MLSPEASVLMLFGLVVVEAVHEKPMGAEEAVR
jgi:hypothetical protein